jgi:putative ABC transport system permease protein
MKANIDPAKISPDRIDEVLQKLGIDPQRVPASVKAKFKMKSAASQPTPAQSTADVGDLMKDATVAPEPAKKEEAGEDPDAYHLDEHGDIVTDLPQDEWTLSAILVQSRAYPGGGYQSQQLIYNFKLIDDRATAVSPAVVMREFFDTFLAPSATLLLLISVFVVVVAAASIMTTIYNSVSARLREIAILRALGATRTKILTLICAEAVTIGVIGGLLGFVVGHLLSAAGSVYLNRTLGESINWISIGREEWSFLAIVAALALLAGLVPALKAYQTPVANNLVAA